MIDFSVRCAALLLICVATCQSALAQQVDYRTEIKPLLAEKCYACHGALKQESDLRLETRALMDRGSVLVAGSPNESELLARVSAQGDGRMPPHGEGSALRDDEIDLLRRWIGQGAKAPDEAIPKSPSEHWAFLPIQRPDMTLAAGQNPIDGLLTQQRRLFGVTTTQPASRTIALRRLYLDLIGLPPTLDQLDDDRAWEVIVDQLLESDAHAERWARHWMDVWRYSDWYGLGQQLRVSQKHLWHWRDWIIGSLAEDKGYDRMVMEMLAGDELEPNDPEVVAATGFLARNYYLFNRTTWLDSTIEHTGKAFLGLTLNCAKCHDHKYDPISQVDYYRFRALFEPHQVRLDQLPGESDLDKDGLPRVFDDHIDEPTYLHIRGDAKNPDTSRVISPGVPAILEDLAPPIVPIDLPHEAYAPGTRPHVQQQRLRQAIEAVDVAEKELKAAKKGLAQKVSDTETASTKTFEFTDEFDAADTEAWELVGLGWEYAGGMLKQTKPTRERYMARLRQPLPRDFEMTCRYTTTGGTTYKSVTFRFDQSADGKHANYVYSSAHAPAPKVQAAYTRDGKDHYPGEGRTPTKIEVGHQYQLKFAVRDTLVNVWLDGEFLQAYRFPGPRREGSFSLSAFDATVAFDSLSIRSLPPDLELTESGQVPMDAESALSLAESKHRVAVARVASVQATIAADRSKHLKEPDADLLANAAVRAQALLQKRIAELNQLGRDDKAKQASAQELRKANERLAAAESGAVDYLPLKGSRKALETPAHSESQYPHVYSATSTGRRLALARWVTNHQNPLTAHVAVNHIWMRHFGSPLVDSVFDFGLRAKPPRHQAVLDLLADELIQNGWSLRHLHRLIVTSDTFRLRSSTAGEQANHRLDPENQLYWRANARRMESQVVRDSLLQLAGQLDSTIGGPSIDPAKGGNRRSLYFLHSRDQQDRFLSLFDDADLMQCYRRSESIVPQQALALSNSKLAIEMSATIARQLPAESEEAFVRSAFETILCRDANDEELAACVSFLKNGDDRTRAQLVLAILNHNDFVTIR
ncbi:MAG: PSD1 and planctomycete cytochrome C domain-containing protein [Planctomycetota bacterium]